MEKIKVNMSPNPLDVQTIHASQNDGEARQWEFELHNNGELIDTSDVKEQLVFKTYKGGTEQILPENGSTPTTSPFIGDIKYPQGLLTNQEFAYRKSPTESDGLAKITDIKGNTLVWNQQIPIPTSQSGASSGIDVTNNGDGSLTLNGTPSNMNINWWIWGNYATDVSILSLKASHKYFVKDCNLYRETGENLLLQNIGASPVIWSPSADYELGGVRVANGDTSKTYTNVKVYPMIIDLTQMGLDITDPSEFTSLFSLPYYAYNQGTLLSFNGNGIKTTGKNLLKTNISSETVNGVTFTVNKDENGELTEIIVSGTATQRANFYILPQGTNNVLSTGRYILSCGFDSQDIYMSSYNASTGLSYRVYGSGVEVPYVTGEDYSIYISVLAGATANNIIFKPMLRLADVEDATFEPYSSSTLSLPISTYFPTGMKSAGSVYDELTPSKAITRVGTVTLNGTEIWHAPDSSGNCWMDFRDMKISTDYTKTMTATVTVVKNRGSMVANSVTGYDQGTLNYMYFKTSDATQSVANVKAYLQANPVTLNYELKASTETSFTTASLVTENAEIQLSNEDGVLIGKCTEQLSAEPGFHDAKIKLSDGDGECYSNKIQLHIERSPQ